jgi:ectoine hydroxylase-related dioxygenase (phytanoyl-CoA dioxygenase family)
MSLLDTIRHRLAGAAAPAAAPPWAPPHPGAPSFAELSENPDPALLPPLDRPDANITTLTPHQRAWRDNGVVVIRDFFDKNLLHHYIRRRQDLEKVSLHRHMVGWDSPTPYEHVPEMRDICLHKPLMEKLHELVGEPMLLHLALTGWISTERNWHQDDYLNPPHVNSWYAAIWIPLAQIGETQGPFEYIPGSHRWPLLRQSRVKAWMSPAELARRNAVGSETWAKDSERFVVPAIQAEIAARGAATESFLADTGDLLIWHGRLMHRGSAPTGNRWRPALIAHYSGVNHRPDMTTRARTPAGHEYFLTGIPLQ